MSQILRRCWLTFFEKIRIETGDDKSENVNLLVVKKMPPCLFFFFLSLLYYKLRDSLSGNEVRPSLHYIDATICPGSNERVVSFRQLHSVFRGCVKRSSGA